MAEKSTAHEAVAFLKSYIDYWAGWLRWALGIAIVVALTVTGIERLYGFDVPWLSPADPVLLAYLAGALWLSK